MDIRKFIFVVCTFLPWCAIGAVAQETGTVHRQEMRDSAGRHQERHYKPMLLSPKQQAQHITDRMKALLSLTEKQYDKLYKLHLKEARQQMESGAANGCPPMDNRRGGGPGGHPGGDHPPMRDGGMGPGSNGGHPYGGFGQHPPYNPGMPPDAVKAMKKQRAKDEKRRKKMEKKIRKILTEEQYVCWLEERMRPAAEPEKGKPGLPPDRKFPESRP